MSNELPTLDAPTLEAHTRDVQDAHEGMSSGAVTPISQTSRRSSRSRSSWVKAKRIREGKEIVWTSTTPREEHVQVGAWRLSASRVAPPGAQEFCTEPDEALIEWWDGLTHEEAAAALVENRVRAEYAMQVWERVARTKLCERLKKAKELEDQDPPEPVPLTPAERAERERSVRVYQSRLGAGGEAYTPVVYDFGRLFQGAVYAAWTYKDKLYVVKEEGKVAEVDWGKSERWNGALKSWWGLFDKPEDLRAAWLWQPPGGKDPAQLCIAVKGCDAGNKFATTTFGKTWNGSFTNRYHEILKEPVRGAWVHDDVLYVLKGPTTVACVDASGRTPWDGEVQDWKPALQGAWKAAFVYGGCLFVARYTTPADEPPIPRELTRNEAAFEARGMGVPPCASFAMPVAAAADERPPEPAMRMVLDAGGLPSRYRPRFSTWIGQVPLSVESQIRRS